MTATRTSVSMLFAATALCFFAGGCAQEDAAARMPDAASATVPVAGAASAVAHAADALNPLSARDEMSRAMDAFLAVKSYHAQMTTSTPKGAMTMDMDFVAPDRFRMTMPMGTQFVIGDTMYMTMNGRTVKMALPKGQATQWRDPAQLAANKATMSVEALGRHTIDGQSTRKFRIRNTQPQPSESTLWINGDGYPLKMEVAGGDNGNVQMTVRYSRFNDPAIRIDPPSTP